MIVLLEAATFNNFLLCFRMEMDRVKYKWTHRWSKTYKQTIFYNTYEPKDPPPYNLTFYKGELHGLFSRRFVQFIIESDVGRKYLQWCWDSGHPSEHYWNVLNYNRHLQAPGGYTGVSKQHVYDRFDEFCSGLPEFKERAGKLNHVAYWLV